MDWEPISRESLDELVAEELADATAEDRALFARAVVTPTKWHLSPWGDLGGGFWVVAVMEDRVLWYNNIEEGFKVSRFISSAKMSRSCSRYSSRSHGRRCLTPDSSTG